MSDPRRRLLILPLVAAVVAGCGTPPTVEVAPGAVTPDPTVVVPSSPTTSSAPTGPTVAPDQGTVALTQDWATATLTDVATGEAFRIADHAGSVVILETMAMWCSSCRAQQGDVQAALARLPADRVVYVVLDVDPNEEAASLAEYRVDNGFDGRYAIAGGDVARALASEFGDQFLNPPSTPMLVIGTDGTVTQTDYGHKTVDEIVALAEAHGA